MIKTNKCWNTSIELIDEPPMNGWRNVKTLRMAAVQAQIKWIFYSSVAMFSRLIVIGSTSVGLNASAGFATAMILFPDADSTWTPSDPLLLALPLLANMLLVPVVIVADVWWIGDFVRSLKTALLSCELNIQIIVTFTKEVKDISGMYDNSSTYFFNFNIASVWRLHSEIIKWKMRE